VIGMVIAVRTPAMKLAIPVMLAAVLGCGSKKERSGSSSSDQLPESDKKPVTAELFGKSVAPFGVLSKLKWGMSEVDAKAAAPELFTKKCGYDGWCTVRDAQLADVSYSIGFDKNKRVLDHMSVSLKASAKAMLATAWGASKDAKDSIGRARTYWFDPVGGWRAYSEAGFDPQDLSVDLHAYLPAAKLLGDGPDALGFAPQGVIGATVAELRTRFPTTIVEETQAEAQANQKGASKLAGQDLDKALGPAKAEVFLELAPTEWEEFWTRVNFYWGKDGKVRDAYFDLKYEGYGPARDELHALIEKKWGKGQDFTRYGETATLYGTKAPFAVVKDDTIMHAWNVRIVDTKPEPN
jgi:hypothetical protein